MSIPRDREGNLFEKGIYRVSPDGEVIEVSFQGKKPCYKNLSGDKGFISRRMAQKCEKVHDLSGLLEKLEYQIEFINEYLKK